MGQQDRDGEGDFAQSRSHTGAVSEDQTLAGDYEHYRLVRDGDELRGYVSQDGLFWRQFASFSRPDLPETLRVGVAQASFGRVPVSATVESFTLVPYNALPGDFNGDGVVDAADYSVWRGRFGRAVLSQRLRCMEAALLRRRRGIPLAPPCSGTGDVGLACSHWARCGCGEIGTTRPEDDFQRRSIRREAREDGQRQRLGTGTSTLGGLDRHSARRFGIDGDGR